MGATPLLPDDEDDAEHTGGRRGSEQQSPDVQVQAQVRSVPQVQVPVPAVSYPQGPRITIRPRADPTESGRGSRASGEVRVDRGPAYLAAPPPPLPSRFAPAHDGAYTTIAELPPAAGMPLEPRFRALSPAAAEQQMPEGGDPPRNQTPEGDEVQEEEEEDEEAQEGSDESDGGDAQVEGSFPPPPPRPAVQLFSHVVRLQPAEPYGNLHEYSDGYPPGGQQQQQEAGSEEEQQMEDADGGEGASGSYDDGILDGEGSGGEPGQQEQHPPPPPPPMSRYQQQQQPYNYQYQQQRAHEEDAV